MRYKTTSNWKSETFRDVNAWVELVVLELVVPGAVVEGAVGVISAIVDTCKKPNIVFKQYVKTYTGK